MANLVPQIYLFSSSSKLKQKQCWLLKWKLTDKLCQIAYGSQQNKRNYDFPSNGQSQIYVCCLRAERGVIHLWLTQHIDPMPNIIYLLTYVMLLLSCRCFFFVVPFWAMPFRYTFPSTCCWAILGRSNFVPFNQRQHGLCFSHINLHAIIIKQRNNTLSISFCVGSILSTPPAFSTTTTPMPSMPHLLSTHSTTALSNIPSKVL